MVLANIVAYFMVKLGGEEPSDLCAESMTESEV